MKVIKHKDRWYLQSDTGYKEILLSTDTELQKDGIQAIDDAFLEWFVKNPSCESVEVCKNPFYEESNYEYYKIIIPKEEPKQYPIGGYAPGYYSCTCITCKKEFTGDKRAVQCEPCAIETTKEKSKQKTLEEAAENYASKKLQRPITIYNPLESNVAEYVSFIEGAKYQAERMYSEEEVRTAIFTSFLLGVDRNFYSKEIEDKIIQQLKKK